ncbi:hypothetical protein FD09_GL001952 [Schleiferilactobacillus perolens DSM 12744]|uniref:Uncharacterized protein n=1 Tax=Schleiferilactobacillus perolens DSM 12744 TaxID=1423792 RepID=A0A0R1N0T7_9LACO|nr:hypothetical protein FD09_GL001952 [Schleiferilactobacillus perolens DSM 12744]
MRRRENGLESVHRTFLVRLQWLASIIMHAYDGTIGVCTLARRFGVNQGVN